MVTIKDAFLVAFTFDFVVLPSMGVVGSIPSENNQTVSSSNQLSHAHVCMKQLRSVATRLEHRQKLKQRQKIRLLRTRNLTVHEQLKKQIEYLELQQNRLFNTVTQLHRYREELQLVYEQIHSIPSAID